jgi:Xaa-Pro aminopeptidase
MPKTRELKKYVIISRAIALLIVIGAIIIIAINMNKPGYKLGELPERFIHEHEVDFFDKAVFAERRERILEGLDAEIILLSAATRPDFRYVTGFDERRGIAVIRPGTEEAYTLFVTPWEVYTVMWTGEVHGKAGALDTFGADATFALNEFEEKLPEMLKGKAKIHLHDSDQQMQALVKAALEENNQTAEIIDFAPVLHEHRIFKDEWEIAQIRQAVDVTMMAHHYIMETLRPGLAEHEVQAGIEYIFRRNGLSPHFSTIVGTGPNTCLLHHNPGQLVIKDGDLVLVDIGAASVGGYSADVTRTYPANGRFSPKQKEIYELVLKAADEARKLMNPGHKMLDCHHKAMDVMVAGLHEMGLIPDTTSWWQKRFYLQHRVNHYIGLQSHDVGIYGYDNSVRDNYILNIAWRGRKLEPGMVMTLEPGMYFKKNLLDGIHELFGHLAPEEELNAFVDQVRPIYEQYEGIGVRIEDDILITADGYVNLSDALPKSIEDIEKAMQR